MRARARAQKTSKERKNGEERMSNAKLEAQFIQYYIVQIV
jgi:hypothetical protein